MICLVVGLIAMVFDSFASHQSEASCRPVLSDYVQDSVKTPDSAISGQASWYRNRGGLYAASTRFKKGTALRVLNVANGRTVDIVINDYGPNRRRHPNRIIDLDRVAFCRLASPEAGLIDVIVYPLDLCDDGQ